MYIYIYVYIYINIYGGTKIQIELFSIFGHRWSQKTQNIDVLTSRTCLDRFKNEKLSLFKSSKFQNHFSGDHFDMIL